MSQNQDGNQNQDQQSIIINSTCPISWKLYQNPFFTPTNTITNYSSNHYNNDSNSSNPLKLKHKQLQRKYSTTAKYLHHPLDFRMNSNVVAELKAELDKERKLRKKMESLNKKLTKELVDLHQGVPGNKIDKPCVCEELTKEVSRLKEEIEKMKIEMDEERRMLRMAEVLREERVQMKLADAHLFYHQEFLKQFLLQQQKNSASSSSTSASSFARKVKNGSVQRKAAVSPEAENPHIKQGIKGFVEFQRAIKARNNGINVNTTANCHSSYYNNKVECQKAQLRVLFKHKCSLPYSHHHDHLILS
ncbi:hypothetical protein SOVF_013250 [Spinacia oleracea]|nr:hypothetical protein SOVF_013250 [Spinacia oleracea]